jgi:NADPH-dependent 2,4-dienoyl-CoA reductase/sulfur reductase-like enzyme
VREHVGPTFPVIIRVSTEELVRDGYNISFMKWLAPRLVEAGADAIHASVGVASTPGGYTIASMDTESGFNLPRAHAIKQVTSVPVIAVGRINDPRLADVAIRNGHADMVSFGRQHLTDPDFLAKSRRDDFDNIRWCLACNQGCIERLAYELKTVTCTINPECGKEYKGQPERADSPLRIWVIGAGPAGLSAAISASDLGHTVEVFERDTEPGGQLRPASRPLNKQALADWVEWARRQLAERDVEIRLDRAITADDIRETRPDHVILATGALPAVPDIPGIGSDNVVDARRVLLGKVTLEGDAVVLGAGYVGMETADFLVARGVRVTILEMSPVPPIGKHTTHGYWLHARLKEAGAKLVLGATVVSIEPGVVHYTREGTEERLEHEGPVVTALGAAPESALSGVLDSAGIPYTVVGDADSPRRLLEAVHEGHEAGASI